MASIGHVAIALTSARIYDQRVHRRWPAVASMAAWTTLSMLPDIDVIGFGLGVPYAAPFGHRGATHSFLAAILVALLVLLVLLLARPARLPPRLSALLALAVVASHDVLDTMTDGGLGCALLWPLTNHRYFAPWRPIPVAPIGLHFLSGEGLRVAAAELLMFLPLVVYGVWPRRTVEVAKP
jgi:inner membrane protein